MTPRFGTMRLACMFSSILLFGAAGLLLFISLQDPIELSPQQVPGEPRGCCLPLWVHVQAFLKALGCRGRGDSSLCKQRKGSGFLLAGVRVSVWGCQTTSSKAGALASIAVEQPLVWAMERLPIWSASLLSSVNRRLGKFCQLLGHLPHCSEYQWINVFLFFKNVTGN